MFPGLRKRRPTWTFFEETRKNHFCWKSLQAKNIPTFFGNSKNVSKFLAEFFDRLFDSPTVRWMLTFPYFNILPNLRSTESFFFKKMGQPRPLFRLFSVFSNKHYNFYNKYMWKNVHPVYGAGIRTHDLRNVSLFS